MALQEMESLLHVAEGKISSLQDVLGEREQDLDSMVRSEAVIATEADSLRKRAKEAENIGDP
jgi:hypothetical protein